ncbi:hypothetical protein ACQ4PT_051138 [Festuca glaucescens]
MDYLLKVVALLVTAFAIAIHLLIRAKKSCPANLPPGSLGLPVIGQTLGILRAMHVNSVDQWFGDRIGRYGLVSKFSLFGKPTVLLAGPAANKFMFFSSLLPPYLPLFSRRIMGEKNILSLYGDDHRRIRGALMEFLKPDMLKLYVNRIDAEVRHHLEENWAGRTIVTVLPLMKRLTFDIISALVFGLEASAVRDALAHDVGCMLAGMTAIPVNLPFTTFGRSLKASQRARRLLEVIIREKKAEQGDSPNKNLIGHLLSMRDEHGEQLLTHEEIIDNSLIPMIAGHDTASTLMTFMIRHLANDPATLAAMVQEHEEIARNKADGEALTWVDLSNMKFTWRVALETLRIVPVVVASYKIALDDIEFGGYSIPKGWQVFWTSSATHMDPSIFPEPAKFDPSRFENLSSTTPPCSFIGFGAGPRICPGMEFAKVQILVTMHYLVRHFTWKLSCKENTFTRNPIPSPLHGLPIQLQHKTTL